VSAEAVLQERRGVRNEGNIRRQAWFVGEQAVDDLLRTTCSCTASASTCLS
jgi:hypothetical protein